MTYPVDDAGNPRVDFVWGPMPMQPNEGRVGYSYPTGPNFYSDEENPSWIGFPPVGSDDIDANPIQVSYINGDGGSYVYPIAITTEHEIATTGWSNYPAFLPNYAGDGDSGLEVIAPNVVGLSYSAALPIIQALGLQVGSGSTTTYVGATVDNDNTVKSQAAEAGSGVNAGSEFILELYQTPTVPNVVDFDSVSAAEEYLNSVGLVLGTVTTSTSGATLGNNGWVKSQSIAAGTKVNAGTAVNLVEYDYPVPVAPSVTGSVAGFNRVSAGTSFALNGDQSVMYVVGRTVKPTVGDTISVTGSNDASHNVSWTVAAVENNDSYNTGGTAVKVTLVTGAITSDTATGGTWTLTSLPNVIGLNKNDAKALLVSAGWSFYTGYPAYPDGLWSGSGTYAGPDLGPGAVNDVYTYTPYGSIPAGTLNTGQEIFFYCNA